MILRREQGENTEIVLISHWESMEAVRAFAGENPEKSVYYPEDEHYLLQNQLSCGCMTCRSEDSGRRADASQTKRSFASYQMVNSMSSLIRLESSLDPILQKLFCHRRFACHPGPCRYFRDIWPANVPGNWLRKRLAFTSDTFGFDIQTGRISQSEIRAFGPPTPVGTVIRVYGVPSRSQLKANCGPYRVVPLHKG